MIQTLDRSATSTQEPVLPIAGQPLTFAARQALDTIIARDTFATTAEALARCLVTCSQIIERTGNTTMVHVCYGRQIIREYAWQYPHPAELNRALSPCDAPRLSLHDLQSVYAALELSMSAVDLFNIAVLAYYDLAPRSNGLVILAPLKHRKRRRSAGIDLVPCTIAAPPGEPATMLD